MEQQMERQKKMLPIGIEDFAEMRCKDYYYVDKTGLIRDLLTNQAKVTLFTRPRRFGKSLNMSMLAHFFSPDGDKSVFDGLEISKETALCEKYMGNYPVVFLTLKGIDAQDYEEAFQAAVQLIVETAMNYEFLSCSEKLSIREKARYEKLLDDSMDTGTLSNSLKLLCQLLEKHFGRKVVLLIDEYDVPLARAHRNGYYDRMVSLMRGLLGAALKTNASLEFAVLTGCLRVSKESIFTGLNNLRVISITDDRFDEYFGFTGNEVKGMLAYYGLSDSYDKVRRWYDGYQFGSMEVYCPWDVLNYCDLLRKNAGREPQNYWINTSGNDAVERFVGMADGRTRDEIESLVAGEAVEKTIREDLTYPEMYKTIDNLWSLLFMTGYLTQRGQPRGRVMRLAIPNLEVRDIFVTQILDSFDESVRADTDTLDRFCAALRDGDAGTVEQLFARYLERSISIRDNAVPDDRKENFYHGVMLGILMANGRWDVLSNREAGKGYADILAKAEDGETGIVIEMKYADGGELEDACRDALEQIDERRYTDAFKYTRVKTVRRYGIGCYKKSCRVMKDDSDRLRGGRYGVRSQTPEGERHDDGHGGQPGWDQAEEADGTEEL